MTTAPRTDYTQSPMHQGTRQRTGDQVDQQFIHDLLTVLGDCRLLWLPNLTDTTTSTERSRHAAAITWSESMVAFDATRARLGAGVVVIFNGTDEEGDTPDADRLSFGDGAVEQPFSVVALIKPDVNNATMTIASKQNSATAEEWELYLNSSGRPSFNLRDESASANLGRQDATAFGTSWGLAIGTYDGGGSEPGIRVYKDAARVDDTSFSSGSYTAMENTAALVNIVPASPRRASSSTARSRS
jgi:hypothetical protein